jgi:hypothetical protein
MRPSADIAADEVGVMVLEIRRPEDAASEDALAKARCESFDLSFNPGRKIGIPAVGNMAVRPGDVFSGRCTSPVEDSRLGDEHVGPFRNCSFPHQAL